MSTRVGFPIDARVLIARKLMQRVGGGGGGISGGLPPLPTPPDDKQKRARVY